MGSEMGWSEDWSPFDASLQYGRIAQIKRSMSLSGEARNPSFLGLSWGHLSYRVVRDP